ncbi:AtpZ/AtpI family protein [Paraurantiacibacter namhicola]|uniref:Putative F0F1-ATPase subunit n=1 Tax=Paraurantiacibacter namhicola TaxID=645517 RepID=A0A1C7D8E1_9SPHN|nr:AtpZ/AtpI family protein [Paraurantiacibacter namhicola]ANU07744.1 Putative F0F1-ATPase subunit [Paraurantiacibacter namhicola]
MSKEKPARDPIVEDARIDALEERLKSAREREEERNRPSVKGADANEKLGNQVLGHLLGGPLGGALIGWVIDQFAGTSPWGLLVMLGLGIVVAFRNIIRISGTRP